MAQTCNMTVTFGYSPSSRMAALMDVFQSGFQSQKWKELLEYFEPEPPSSHPRQSPESSSCTARDALLTLLPNAETTCSTLPFLPSAPCGPGKVPTAELTWMLTCMGLLSAECSFHATLVCHITQPLESRSSLPADSSCSLGSNVLGRCHCMLSQWLWTKWPSCLWRCHLFDKSFQWIIVKELLEKRINHKWWAYAIFVLGIDGQITEKIISILEYGISKNGLKFIKCVITFLMFFWDKMKAWAFTN